MSQFISPRSATNSPASRTKGLPRLGSQRSVTALPEDLSKSSILAIHRPIAARRRTESGEPGECQGENGMYASQTSEGKIADEGEVPEEADETLEEAKQRPLPPSRTSTAKTEKSMGRRLKLAEKLMDVFGLEEVEDVVAGESLSSARFLSNFVEIRLNVLAFPEFPCWLFRSVLLQGYLYLTTGHICFYAYLSQREVSIHWKSIRYFRKKLTPFSLVRVPLFALVLSRYAVKLGGITSTGSSSKIAF